MRLFKRDLWPVLTLLGFWLQQHIQQGGRKLRAFLHAFARGIQRPSTHYRIALLLATALAIVLWWSLCLSLFPQTLPLTFVRYLL